MSYILGSDVLSEVEYEVLGASKRGVSKMRAGRQFRERVRNPQRVVVSPTRGSSTVYEGNVDTITVWGGKRWIPAWNNQETEYTGPGVYATVKLKDGTVENFENQQGVSIFYGTRETVLGSSSAKTFTDKATVERVQRALAAAKNVDPSFSALAAALAVQKDAYGKLGPVTKTAVKALNTRFGTAADDESITDATLEALMKLSSPSTQMPDNQTLDLSQPVPPSVTSTPSAPAPESSDGKLFGLPYWQVGVGAGAAVAVVAGAVLIIRKKS